MDIILKNLGKRFNTEWIFRNLDFHFHAGKKYAITGPNGSGKSTLLQVLSGAMGHNEGDLIFQEPDKILNPEHIHKKISFAAPYLELIEEMTLTEFLHFHQQMKGWVQPYTTNSIIPLVQLASSRHKKIRDFSSGMKQRVKLAQAVFSNTTIILLDEPLSNLDAEGIALYEQLINDHCGGRMVIISSNDRKEYHFCDDVIDIKKYKPTHLIIT